MDYEIRSTKSNLNMAAWCSEKSEHAVAGLASAIERVNSLQIDSAEKNILLHHLRYALHDATKLLAFSAGAEWNLTDPQTIYEEGYPGYEKILVRYGLLSETAAEAEKKRKQALISQIETLLAGPRSPNRTLLYALLANKRLSSPALKALMDALEQLTFGESDWEQFVGRARAIAEEYQKED